MVRLKSFWKLREKLDVEWRYDSEEESRESKKIDFYRQRPPRAKGWENQRVGVSRWRLEEKTDWIELNECTLFCSSTLSVISS